MQKILGVDFDNIIFLDSFPDNFTKPNWPVIWHIRERQEQGWYIILVTCRTTADLVNAAVVAAESVGVHFDAINANHPAQIAKWGDCRKIYCDEYIDDRNITIDRVRKAHRIIYIAGKMRGLPDNWKKHFDTAEMFLRSKGYIVLNPSVLPDGMPDDKYMPICLSMLDAADSVYMLDGRKDSSGAKAEYDYAVCQGKTIIFEDGKSTEGTEYGCTKDTEDDRGQA